MNAGTVEKLASIQVLRFFAAAMVLVHNAILYVAPFEQVPQASTINTWSYIGAAGVHIFFVISGLVMAYTAFDAFERPGATKAFLWRRFVRIYPIYWIVAIAYLTAQVAMGSFGLGLAEVFGAFLLLPGQASLIIVPGWTLAYEVIFYLIFGGLLFFSRTVALTLITLGFPFLIISGQLLGAKEWGAFADHLTSPLLMEFLTGVWIGWLLRSSRMPKWTNKGWVFPTGCVFAGLVLIVSPALTAKGIPDIVTMGPGSILLVATFAVSNRQWFNRVAWLGDRSYMLYLIHQLPMIILSSYIAGLLGEGLWAFTFTLTALCVLALMLTLLMYSLVERPLLSWLKRL